jgi:CDP-diacylglycerol---serine O-phosphatidyltransferase
MEAYNKAKASIKQIEQNIQNKRLNLPLVLTYTRILFSVLVFIAIIFSKWQIGTLLFVFAILTDFLDGYLARKYGQATALGKYMDPLADKILINLTVSGLALVSGFPLWALSIFLLRDVLLIIFGIRILRSGREVISPSSISKINTFLQMAAIIAFYAKFEFTDLIISGAVLTTILSGLDYTLKYSKSRPRKHQSIVSFIQIPDVITLANAGCGLLSIFFAIDKNLLISAILILLCVVFDFLDGKIARKINRQGDFGKELDSLADIISFGVSPAVFGMSALTDPSFYTMGILFIFLCAGILRLARFNISSEPAVYYGMPITLNGVIVPLVYFLGGSEYFNLVFIILAVLMISTVKVKKVL